MDEKDGKKKLTHQPVTEVNWDGAMAKHSCTDIPCLILFIVFLLVWGGVGIFALTNGNIDTVLYPVDTSGNVCGTGDMATKKYLLYFDLTRCLNPAILAIGCNTPQVCVEKCPSESLTILTDKEKMLPFCSPPVNETTDDWKKWEPKDLVIRDICPAWLLPSDHVLGRCIPKPSNLSIDAKNTKDKKAISSQTIHDAVSMLGALLNVRDFFTRIASDVEETGWIIAIALLSAALVCFVWIIMMRFLTGIMVWTSIALVHTLFLGVLCYSLYRFWLVKDILSGPDNIFQVNYNSMFFHNILQLRDTWISFAVISGVILFICVCLFLALRKRIQIAIKMIEHGSKAVSHMLCSLFFPVFPFFMHFCVIAWFLATGIYMSSMSNDKKYSIFYEENELENSTSGLIAAIGNTTSDTFENKVDKSEIQKKVLKPTCPTPTVTNSTSCDFQLLDECDPMSFNQTNCHECEPPILCRYNEALTTNANWMVTILQWFNLFGFYWAMNFVTSYGEMVLAGVFAKWYWSRNKSKIPCGSLTKSIFNTTVFHLGTLAFGSLIIAIIKTVRAMVTYIESKLKKTKQNDFVRCLLCTCKCCLWMLEKFMKFINRNAYIVCAIKSTNFCTSSKQAFMLIISNPVRTFVLNKMVDFLLLVGKFIIIAAATIVSYFVLHGWIPEIASDVPTLNFVFTPLIFIAVGTYFIASAFFGVYHMAVDTIYLSMLQDLKQNDGTPEKPYMMEKDLQKTMGVMQKFREEELKYRREKLEAENAELQKMLESSPKFRDY